MSNETVQDDTVRIEQNGAIGYLVLSRPANLNSLDTDMVAQLHQGLRQHEADATVNLIVIRSNSDRAFCAGGNMKLIRQQCLDGEYSTIENFFEQEYALNQAIADCSKPYLALIDGVAMGGGLGISVHGQFRVVTERAVLAMPETRIGFFPDVGATYFLPRLPLNCGLWLALTAAHVKGAEAVDTGLATHFVHSSRLDVLMDRLAVECANVPCAETCVTRILDELSNPPDNSEYKDALKQRAEWFCDDDIHAIRHRLQTAASESEDAAGLLELLDSASPFSVDLTLRLFAQAMPRGEPAGSTNTMTLQQCLANEFTATAEGLRHPDFIEGVRAVLIDKDHQPRWQVGT